MAQTTIVDQEGVVYRQVYGAGFAVPAIVEPLKDLLYGRHSDWSSVDGLLNRLRLFCTLYDPRTDRYRFDYAVVIGAAIGVASLSVVLLVLVREWRRTSRNTHA
jgi:protein SCO1/2